MVRNPRSVFLAYAVSAVAGRMVVAWAMAIALLVFLSARPAAAQAVIEYGHVATGSSAGLAKPGSKAGSALPSDKKSPSMLVVGNQPAMETVTEDSREDANRRALEQRAGQDAARLSLKSVPARAVVRIDGMPVGLTPLQISLAPGAYKIEMEGPRMEFGKQQVTLGAKETREIHLPLSGAPRYPNRITLQ